MIDYKSEKVRKIIERQKGIDTLKGVTQDKIKFGTKTFSLYNIPELESALKDFNLLYSYLPDSSQTNCDIEENFYSSNIEGAKISTINETREICELGVSKNKKEGMVLGFSRAVKKLLERKPVPLGVELANELQQELIYYCNDSVKKGYRDNSVYVGSEFKIIFKPCDCALIPSLYPCVFGFEEYPVVIRAALIHFFLVYLHPYFDGNGRTARLLLKECLVRNGYEKLTGISISKHIHGSIHGYAKAIKSSEEEFDVTHFVVYILNILEEVVSEYQDTKEF